MSAYNKLHSLWVLTHRSSLGKSICEEELNCTLQVPCETRWNSKFDAIYKTSKPEIQPKLNPLIERLKNELTNRTASHLQVIPSSEFFVLVEYLRTMGPIARALNVLQGEINCSQGFILPVIISMNHHITQLDNSTNTARDFKATMLKIINKRLGNYLKFSDENNDLILAAVTIPAFKANFIENDNYFEYAKRLLITELNWT